MTNLHFEQRNLNGYCNSNTDGWQPSPGLPGPEGRTIVCGHSVALNAAETFKVSLLNFRKNRLVGF
jgi:hypothetical protein